MENPFVESWKRDPMSKYTIEECSKMSHEKFEALLEEHNKYVRAEFERLKDVEVPKFNSMEELRAYFQCSPLEEVVKEIDKLF